MSSTTIMALVFGAIIVLLLLGYLNHILEKARIEKARKKAEQAERQMRLEMLSDSIPRQFLTPDFKQLLHRVELHFAKQLLDAEPGNKKLEERLLQLQERLELGGAYQSDNPQLSLQDEAQVKEVRFLLESLQAQLVRAAQDRVLSAQELKGAVGHIQLQLINLYLEYFRSNGQRMMQQGQFRQAKIAYERAVKLIRRQTSTQFTGQLETFTRLLKQAEAAVEQQNRQSLSRQNELAGKVESETSEEAWKKKQIYD